MRTDSEERPRPAAPFSLHSSGAAVAVLAALLACWCGTAARAQEPASSPSAPVVLKAARLFDATGESVLSDGAVLVRGDTIVEVGADVGVPSGARVIDLGDATLLPGFIDAHAHLTLEPDANYYRKRFNELMRSETEQAFYAAANAKRTLEAGFTTIRHVGASHFIDVGLRNAVAAGLTAGPRMLVSGHPITATGGSCDQPPFPADRVAPRTPREGVCNGADECRAAVRNQIKWGADVIKVCASGGVLSYDPVDVPQLTKPELEAIISEAHAWGRKVAAHAHGDTAARLAIEAGVDSIEHGSFLTEDTLRLMKREDVYLVPTCVAIDWVKSHADDYPPDIARKARTAAAAHAETLKNAMRLGVPVALGTDATVRPDGHGRNAMEFVLMTELGMSPAAALLAGTRDAARLLGVEARVGTLEAGKTADIVAVRGDAVADIRATEQPLLVMQGGRIVMYEQTQ